MEYILSLFAAVIGGFVGWFIANKKTVEAVDSEAEARERLAVLETQEEERAKSLEREKQFFEKSLSEMENKFKGMAQSALRANNEQFLQNTDLKLAPLSEALKKLENKTGEMEKKRSEAYGQLSEQIKGMLEAAGGMVLQ